MVQILNPWTERRFLLLTVVGLEECSGLTPEGRPGMSDVSPLSGISGLSFDSTLLSPLLFFCLDLLPFLSSFFLPPHWGAADAEIKVPSGENTELKRSPFQAWSR